METKLSKIQKLFLTNVVEFYFIGGWHTNQRRIYCKSVPDDDSMKAYQWVRVKTINEDWLTEENQLLIPKRTGFAGHELILNKCIGFKIPYSHITIVCSYSLEKNV
jgi:hypothetical protein